MRLVVEKECVEVAHFRKEIQRCLADRKGENITTESEKKMIKDTGKPKEDQIDSTAETMDESLTEERKQKKKVEDNFIKFEGTGKGEEPTAKTGVVECVDYTYSIRGREHGVDRVETLGLLNG